MECALRKSPIREGLRYEIVSLWIDGLLTLVPSVVGFCFDDENMPDDCLANADYSDTAYWTPS